MSAIRCGGGRATRAVALLLGAFVLVMGVLWGGAPRAAAEPGDEGSSALLSDFGACLAGGGTGSIVLLLDQSGSLESTDPRLARVDAAEFLVERLAEFSSGSGYELEVRVAGFAADYETPGDWTVLTEDATASLASQIETIGGDLRSHDTDYWMALESARQDLADHGATCSAVFWFSDGEYDIDPRASRTSRSELGDTKPYAPGISLSDEEGAEAAVTAGKDDICRPAGVADQLRSSGITLVGIGLTSSDADFSFLRSVTEGGGSAAAERSGITQCGDVASPEGAFFEADDLDSLLLAFDSISAPGDSLSSTAVDICQEQECSAGEVSFVLDRALGSVRILATADSEGFEAYVRAPGDEAGTRFPAGAVGETSEEDGMRVTWLTSRTVEIEMSAQDVPTWDGTWTVGFVDPSGQSSGEQVDVNIHLTSPLVLSWQGLDGIELRQGASIEDAQLVLLDRTDGSTVDPAELSGTLTAQVALTDASGETHELFSTADDEELSAPVTILVPGEAALGEGRITASLQITTAPPEVDGQQTGEGTALQPALARTTVAVLPPQDFPTVASRLDFGVLEEETAVSASLSLTGPGCVWLDPEGTSIVGAPAEAGTITIGSASDRDDDCVVLDDGETGELTLDLSAEDRANGALQGTVTVMIAPADDPDAAQAVTVPFEADMRRPLDAATAGTAFVIALAVGIGLPLAALYLVTWLTARIPRGTLVTGSTRVVLPETGGRTDIDLARSDLTLTSLPAPRRSVTAAGWTLRTRVSPLPTEAPWVELVGDERSVSGATPGSRRGRARLPLGVRGNWIAVPDPQDPRAATVIVLLGAEDQATLDAVLEDARLRLSDRLRSIGVAGGGASGPASDGGAGSSWASPSADASHGRPDPGSVAGSGSGSGSAADGWGSSAPAPGPSSSDGPAGWGSSTSDRSGPGSPWGSS